MTQEEFILLHGTQASLYLQDETFAGFIEAMKGDLLTCIGNTEPEDHKTRNVLYYQHRGLIDLMAHLTEYSAAASLILTTREAEQLALKATVSDE